MLGMMEPVVSEWHLTRTPYPRFRELDELKQLVEGCGLKVADAEPISKAFLESAVDPSIPSPVLITGSLYMIGAAIIASISFSLGGWVIPHGNVAKNAFENKHIKKRQMVDVAENVQMQVDTGVVAYISYFDNRTKTGSGFLLSSFGEKKLTSHLTAETIQYDTLADHKYSWTLRNYTIRTKTGSREKITSGEKIDTMLLMEPKDFFYVYGQQETMTISELNDFIDRQRLRGSAGLATFEVEFHKRFATPFAALRPTISAGERPGP